MIAKERYKESGLYVLLLIIATAVLFFHSPLYSRFTSLRDSDSQSVSRRVQLNTDALSMFRQSPFLGVGLNNFLIKLPKIYRAEKNYDMWVQPVHNIFLLILSETGVTGFLFFIWFLGKTILLTIKKKNHSLFLVLCSLLVLGMFDHYLLTLQQGQLLFTFVLGFIWFVNDKFVRKSDKM